jgi:hypothetical protein
VEELAEMEKAAASTPPAPPDSDADDIMRTQSGKIIHMHSDVWGHWSQTDHTAIRVRGAEYLYDQVKIPPPCPPMMEIAHLEIYQVHGQVFHVCSKKDNWLQQYKAKQKQKLQGGGGSAAAPSAPSAKGKHHHHKARGSAGSSPALAPAAAPASAPAPAPAAASSGGWGAGYFGWGSSASVPPPMPALPDLSSGAGLRPFDPDFFFVRITDSDARHRAIANGSDSDSGSSTCSCVKAGMLTSTLCSGHDSCAPLLCSFFQVVNFHVQTAPTFHLTSDSQMR